MTSRKKAVKRDVFSNRLVVASISENTLASAAYGTLSQSVSHIERESKWSKGARVTRFPPAFDINFCSS